MSSFHTASAKNSKGGSIYYTVDEAISKVGAGPFHWKLLFLTGLIWAADAMEMMLLTFLVPILKDEWELSAPWDGMITFVVFFGMLIGTMTFSILSDRIGRRKVVLICNIFCAIFGTLSGIGPSSFPWNIIVMLVFRFFVGFFIGGAAVAYTLFAEYCPKELRGSLLIIEQGFWSIGALFSVFLGWITLTHLSWHWYLILCSVPLWIVSMFYKWLPESTRYLLAVGDVEQSTKMLQRLARENRVSLPQGKIKPPYANKNKHKTGVKPNEAGQSQTTHVTTTKHHVEKVDESDIENETDFDNNNNNDNNNTSNDNNTGDNNDNNTRKPNPRTKLIDNKVSDDGHGYVAPDERGKISDVFINVYRHTSILLLITFSMCVFGYYGISFISERYFTLVTNDDSDSDSDSEYWKQAIATASEIPGLIVAALWLDKVGRKQGMILCFALFTVCCLGLVFSLFDYYTEYLDISDTLDSYIGLGLVFFARFAVSLAFFILYIYYSEYYPTKVRATALGLASSLGRISGMITSFVSADVAIEYGMLCYAISGFIAFICCILLKQDTTGADMSRYSEIDDNAARDSFELIDPTDPNYKKQSMDIMQGKRLHGDSISLRKSISAVIKYSLSQQPVDYTSS